MPSVRVKRHSYSSLDNNSPNTTRTLVQLFRRNTSHQNEPEPSPLNEASTGTRTMRKRTGSRVQDHLLRAPLLEERRVTHRESPDSSSIDSVVDSPTVGIQLQGGRDEGLDSTLSLAEQSETEHHHDIVEYLDVIDAQVATANNLTNAANAILIPPMSFYSRKPEIRLSLPPSPTIDNARKNEEEGRPVLEDLLDRHVDDVIRRRDKIRRTLKGVWSFLKTPFGVIVGIYGFLVVFWGAAIVFFLAKIINLHNPNTQAFWVEISSQIVNGLFTVTGIGLIPFRVMDTYRIARIYSYKRRTRELRAKAGLPPLLDEDDLPDPMYDPNYVHVLNEEEEKDLHRQQVKFHHSQSWYRPHGTKTHRAFPIGYGLLICCLNDGNSIFQIMLCGTMWGLNRFQRPAWSTGCLIPLGFLCGIGSAVFIALGSGKTKRTAEVENRLKAALATYNREGLEVTRPSDDNSHKAAAAGPPDIEEQSRLRFEKPDVDAESGTLRELSSAS